MTNKEKIWIVGPCSIENEKLFIETAKELNKTMQGKEWYYKGSFDKANRTSINGKRGPGLDKAIEIFKKIKEEIPEIKLITDVHETHQVKKLAGHVDCIQIPAFLCRQTDLLIECGKYFDKVNIKKGQWIEPTNLIHAPEKVRKENKNAEVWICERGTSFGYSKFIIDFSSVELMKQYFDRTIIDVTHSTQYTSSEGFMKGDKELAKKYLISSTIFGYDGIFAETHPDPVNAVSDGPSMIPLHEFEDTIKQHDLVEKTLIENE